MGRMRRVCHGLAPFRRPKAAIANNTGFDSVKLTALALPAGALAAALAFAALPAARAAGWESVHKYVHPTGACPGQEVLASTYSSGKRTATGEAFDANGNTAAARTWALGTTLTVMNPKTGRSVAVRINDTGPWGTAYAQGARLDLARGAAARIGMHGAQYVCVM